jgi:hypothetical protein
MLARLSGEKVTLGLDVVIQLLFESRSSTGIPFLAKVQAKEQWV